MEFGLDLIGSLRDRTGKAHSAAAPLLDWAGLHARLAAAYDARRALAAHSSGSAAQCGSFDRSAAASLSSAAGGPEYNLHAVNPDDLADGKDHSCIEPDVAALPIIGDRGK